jgi:hypothetical protein
MTTIDEKELLEIEKLKVEVKKMLNDTTRDDLKVKYEAWRLAFYGVAVGLGGTFAIAKTISLMGW